MKRVVSLLTLSTLLCLSENLWAQATPADALDFGYSPSLLDFSSLTLARPGDFYTSVRLGGLSTDFSGLISDPYTDYFRNPAMVPSSDRSELYGDFGSMNDWGKFKAGGYVSAGESAFGLFVDLHRLSTANRSSTSGYGSITSRSESSYQSSQRNSLSGANVRYSLKLGGGRTLGVSYEYSFTENPSWSSESYTYDYLSPNLVDSSYYERGAGGSGPRNDVTIGLYLPQSDGSVQAYLSAGIAALTISDLTISRVVEWRQDTLIYENSGARTNGTTEEDRSILLGLIYQKSSGNSSTVRCLAEAGYSNYDGTGRYLYEQGAYPETPSNYDFASSSRASRGRIWDVRIGVGVERRLSESLNGFFGFNAVDVYHTVDLTENVDSVDVPFNMGPVNRASQDIKAFVLTLPVGFEYAAGEHILIRGGVEGGYIYEDASTKGDKVLNLEGYSSTSYHQENLWSNLTAGTTIRSKEIGEINVYFRYDVLNLSTWSISLMCLL